MDAYQKRIAEEWKERAKELADWSFQNLVNRTDVWGRYLPKKNRVGADGSKNNAITAPFRDARGKTRLQVSSLEKHFKTSQFGGVLGLHSTSPDLTSRWMAIDVDLHDDLDESVSPENNFSAAHGWWKTLKDLGFDPLLFDSNGMGGFHIWLVFAEPMSTVDVFNYLKSYTSDFLKRGVDECPDIFPLKPRWGHYGNWLRLPGKHHTHEHFTRVWNDEPWSDEKWLEGNDAIDRILTTSKASMEQLSDLDIGQRRRTICLDFDGVIHSYQSGWCGIDVIPDPPIHGVHRYIKQLRKRFRIAVYSARCCEEKGRLAIAEWLAKHDIEIDEIPEHKPPAFVYVDDRAIHFDGDWDRTYEKINQFRL